MKNDFPTAPLLLLTATCRQQTAKNIQENLCCSNLNIIRSSIIHRPEVKLSVKSKPANYEKFIAQIFEILDKMITGCSIIYTISIPECTKIAQSLKDHFGDSKVGIYHSQMSSEDKKSNSRLFKNGTIKFMVATNAFGMGININNVRIIIHTSFPLSLDNYVQEIGRAGRDGNVAHSFIFYTKGDTRSLLIILTAGRAR